MINQIPGKLPASETDQDVLTFLAIHGLTEKPVYVEFRDHGYEPNFCHVSAKHAALTKGGNRIHGWAIWQFPEYVLAEFHSIWEDLAGEWIDVTPPKFDPNKVLFVADPTLSIYNHGEVQALYCDRSSIKEKPYWFQNRQINDAEWGMPNDTPDLVRYCAKLGLPDTSMV